MPKPANSMATGIKQMKLTSQLQYRISYGHKKFCDTESLWVVLATFIAITKKH
jgi:hypothetical protein